jgi:hypothetical protein
MEEPIIDTDLDYDSDSSSVHTTQSEGASEQDPDCTLLATCPLLMIPA